MTVGELWHFQYFPTWRPSAILNFKNCNICWLDCHWSRKLLLCTKFHQNWFTHSASASRRTCRGHDRMRPPKFRPNRSIDRRVIAFPIFSNMAAVRHLELECFHYGPPTKSTMRFNYSILSKFCVDPIFAVGDRPIAILWFCQFGWKVPNHAHFLGDWTP